MFFNMGLLLIGMVSMTHAKTLTFSDAIPPRTIDWQDSLTLSKFPPGLGALTGIDIAINASIEGSLKVENLHTTAASISTTTDVHVQVTRPDRSDLAEALATQTNADNFSAFDGTPDFIGTSAKSYPLSTNNNKTITLTNLSASDRQLFTGTDTIQLPVTAKGTTGFVSVGHLLTEFNIAASAGVTVTYTYTESDLNLQFIPQGPLRIGREFSYVLLITNMGPDPATGPITVTDLLPSSFILQSIQGADWTCISQNQTNICTHPGRTPPGTSLPVLTVSVIIASSSPPTLSKVSSVRLLGDINPSNDSITTGLLIAGTPEGIYEPPNYQFSLPEQTPHEQPGARKPESTTSGLPSSPQLPFSFSQEHGAFGGPTKPSSGSILIVDAEGCTIPNTYLSVRRPTPSCSSFDPATLSPKTLSREEIITAALKSFCIPIVKNAIQTAQTHGIITGQPRSHDPATNAETLVILLRASLTIPDGYQLQTALNWYAPFLHFARLHHLVPPDFDPHGSPTRDSLRILIEHIGFISPTPGVNNRPFSPVRLIGDFQVNQGTTCDNRDPHVVSCLTYDPWRTLTFSDVRIDDPTFPAIDLLRQTRIAPNGDYIFSGHGNHSTGIQESHFQEGSFEFQPYRPATRLEVVKIALISNCIPILDYIPRGTPTFTDIHKGFLGNAVHDFTARVFYTAALHGIIKGYPDGTARPHQTADHLEAMAVLLRATGAIPKNYSPKPPNIPGLNANGWYAPYISFASQYSFLPNTPLIEPIARNTLSDLLTKTMEYSEDIRVRAYMSSILPLLH